MTQQMTVSEALDEIPPPAPSAEAPPPDEKPARPRRTRRAASASASAPADGRPPKADKAPRRPRATRKTASKAQIRDTATGLHQMCGAMILPSMGRPKTGAAVLAQAEDAGALWAELSDRYPLIGRLFTSGTDGMLIVQLALLYAPIVQAAMAEGAELAANKGKGKRKTADRTVVPTINLDEMRSGT